MDLRGAVEATLAAGTASMRRLSDGRCTAEGEVRFDGPAVRLTTTPFEDAPPEQLMQLEGDLWMGNADGWVRWVLGNAPDRSDGFGALAMVAALTGVRELEDGRYAGRFGGEVNVAPRPVLGADGLVHVELDEQGRVHRVAYPSANGEEVVELWDFGRDVDIAGPEDYEVFEPIAPSRPTRFAGRNSPMRRRDRRRRRGRRR